jgi:predicted anti-sigma-YlaC factor YlaD
LTCKELVEAVTDYLEGTMSGRDRARFEAHLEGCPHCREYLAQMRKTLDVLGRIEAEDLAPEVQDELVSLYRRWRAD